MKRNFMPLLVVLLFAGIGLMSCSSDDDESGTEIEHPEDNLPNEAKAFVGYWMNGGNGSRDYDFVFFGDGACWMLDGDNMERLDKGYWTYDATTKILATTTGNWQWQVTLSNKDSWAGLSLDTNKPQTYYKKTETFDCLNMILNKSTWKEIFGGTIGFNHHYNTYNIGRPTKGRVWRFNSSISNIHEIDILQKGLALEIVKENEDRVDGVLQYEIFRCKSCIKGIYYYSNVPCGKGTIELKNPTSSTNMTLVFDGTIKGTFKRIE